MNGGMGDNDGETRKHNGEVNDCLGYECEVVECDLKRLAAMFLMKTLEERRITQVALDGIIQDFRGMWRNAMARLQVTAVAVYTVASSAVKN